MVEHLGVVFVDDDDAGVHGFGHRAATFAALLSATIGTGLYCRPSIRSGAVEGHQRALLRDRGVDHAVFDELQRAVVAVHGDDLELADQAQFLGGRRRAHATGGLDTADAGQVRLALQDGLQAIGGLGRVGLVVDDLDDLDVGEFLREDSSL